MVMTSKVKERLAEQYGDRVPQPVLRDQHTGSAKREKRPGVLSKRILIAFDGNTIHVMFAIRRFRAWLADQGRSIPDRTCMRCDQDPYRGTYPVNARPTATHCALRRPERHRNPQQVLKHPHGHSPHALLVAERLCR